MRLILAFIVLAATLSAGRWIDASQSPAPPLVVDDAALANEASGDNWMAFGRTEPGELLGRGHHERGPQALRPKP